MVHPRKVACSVTAVALSSMLAFPSVAFGATYINVDGSEHTSAASGEGWSWDGVDIMTLNNYVGGSIIAEGDLILDLIGENIVQANAGSFSDAGIEVQSGDLNNDGISSATGSLVITGEGSLDVKGDDVGIFSEDGMTIKDTKVLVYAEEVGIATDGMLEIEGSTVGVMATSKDLDAYITGAYGDGLSIKDSSVEVMAQSTYEGGKATEAYTAGIDVFAAPDSSADINIVGSTVEVSAISSRAGDFLTGISNWADQGGIYVDNTDLSVYVSGSEDSYQNTGIYASDGSLGIYDSDLTVTVLGSATRGIAAQIIEDADSKGGPEIIFANSNVSVEATGAAVSSIYYGHQSEEASLDNKGKIVFENSEVTLGGQVQDLLFALGEESDDTWAAGQTIGPNGAIDDDSEESNIATEVTIEPVEGDPDAPAPDVQPEDGATNNTAEKNTSNSGSVIAQTGDDAATSGAMAMLAAAAAALVGFVSAARRKLKDFA